MINIQTLIDQSIENYQAESSASRDTNHFHVSDAGLCYRARFLKRLGVEPTRIIPVGALRKMMAGTAAHEKLQSVLGPSLLEAETEVKYGEDIIGHFDALVADKEQKVLLEFKTVEKFQMGHIKRDGPKYPHVLQMFTYWTCLQALKRNVGQATLVYVQREDYQQIQFDYLWDSDIPHRVKLEWSPLVHYWTRQELPPCSCPTDFGGHGVAYCRYQESDDKCCNEALFYERRP